MRLSAFAFAMPEAEVRGRVDDEREVVSLGVTLT